jgi:hypothetical protein
MGDDADKFEIYLGGEVVGMVWESRGRWFADQYGMADPSAYGATRDGAVQALLAELEKTSHDTA